MRILLTNDDGIFAPGLLALVDAFRDKEDCLVVSPAVECSAKGHSITLYQHISVQEVDLGKGLRGYAIDGTPADCVKFAVSELSRQKPIDLIISGINPGLNSGVSVYYSGTVSAAREGLINGIPGFAVSQARAESYNFSFAVELVRELVDGYRTKALPKDTFLNVNIPLFSGDKPRGVKVAKQAESRFVEWFEAMESKEKDLKKSYFIYGDLQVLNPDGTSCEELLRQGFASITPLKLDLTHYERMANVQKWLEQSSFRVESEEKEGEVL